jgi:hypothetical protein
MGLKVREFGGVLKQQCCPFYQYLFIYVRLHEIKEDKRQRNREFVFKKRGPLSTSFWNSNKYHR